MPDYLNKLPVEIMEKILDDIPMIDILSSVCFVSKRLRSVSLSLPRFWLDFRCTSTKKKSQFDRICSKLLHLTSRIVSLTLFDKDDPMVSAKNALFFSRFNIIDSSFSNLRSLTLTYINYDTWCLFKARLPSLIMVLSIHLVNVGACATSSLTSTILSELLLFSPSLERLSVKMTNYSYDIVTIYPPNRVLSSSVQYFRLECIEIDLLSLFAIAPMLHTLDVKYYPLMTFNNIHPQSLHLQRLSIELDDITFAEMEYLLSLLPRLVHLTLIADEVENDMADGVAWTRLLRGVKQFKFKFLFYENTLINLDSFRTQFWLEEKKWFVIYDQIKDTGYSMLYSNPYCANLYPCYCLNPIILSESTCPLPTSFPHIHHLSINWHTPVNQTFLNRHTHVNELSLSEIGNTFAIYFKNLLSYFDTSQITTCCISSSWAKKSIDALIEFLYSLPRLYALKMPVPLLKSLSVYHWPQIVHLMVAKNDGNSCQILSSDGIDAFCRSFVHVQQLDIFSSEISNLPRLLNSMRTTLTNVFIRQPLTVDKDQFITREWIEQNTELRDFHYASDAENSVSLWL